MSAREEPSYLAFARANVRDAQPSSPAVVQELLARIDRDAADLVAAKPTNEQTAAVTAMAGVSEAMDSMFRGQATQQETLNQIAKTLGAYEMERI